MLQNYSLTNLGIQLEQSKILPAMFFLTQKTFIMTKNYTTKFYTLLFKFAIIFLIAFTGFAAGAQTCTNNDQTICTLAVPDPSVSFTAAPSTSLSVLGTTFTLTGANNSTLSIISGVYRVTTAGCVIVRFAVATAGTLDNTSTISVKTSTGETLTCNITISNGLACIRICDPILKIGTLVTFGLNFNGNLNSRTVTVSAFSTLNVATAANITCPSSFICLDNTSGCTTPCDPNFTILSGKIRVFFPTAIPVGTPTPVVTAVASVVAGVSTNLSQFKLCVSADAGTTVERTYVDYCVYSNIANQTLPKINLVLTLQSFSFLPISCPINLTTIICPTGFTNITDSRTCVNCDAANFAFAAGKIRIFFPTPLTKDLINPVITAISGTGITAGSLKLCALVDGGTNVARTYADYCVFSNIANFTIPLTGPLSFTLQVSSCSPPMVCLLQPVPTPTCNIRNFIVINNGNGGGTGGGLGTCASTSTCGGSTVYLASRLRLNLEDCLPPNVPAPSISSLQTVNLDGTLSLLNKDYCINVSDESAAAIGTTRCFIEYCVYAKVNGNTFFVTPPGTLVFNQESTTTILGIVTPITTSCEASPQVGGVVLPVTLTSFTSQIKDCSVTLNWTTAQELNSKKFDIQNSKDGSTWTTIGSVNAKGNSNAISNYTFEPTYATAGKNYYRLVAIDLDGRLKYSDIVTSLVSCDRNYITVHPNPFVNSVEIILTASINGIAKINIYDNTGRSMLRTSKTVLSGSNNINLNGLERLPKGMYILTVQTNNEMTTQKIIK